MQVTEDCDGGLHAWCPCGCSPILCTAHRYTACMHSIEAVAGCKYVPSAGCAAARSASMATYLCTDCMVQAVIAHKSVIGSIMALPCLHACPPSLLSKQCLMYSSMVPLYGSPCPCPFSRLPVSLSLFPSPRVLPRVHVPFPVSPCPSPCPCPIPHDPVSFPVSLSP
jgi:hypothetical protein